MYCAIFYYALNPNGFLILGKSETINSSGQQLFSHLEKRFKVYRKKPSGSPKVMAEINYRLPAPEIREGSRIVNDPMAKARREMIGLEKTVDDLLYAQIYSRGGSGQSGVLEILQFRGSTNLFLGAVEGQGHFSANENAVSGPA